jgi:response regulator RpfG family c-di-GMP phosphodiesterase
MTRNYLVVSSQPRVREMISAALQRGGFTVTLASTMAEAWKVVRSVSLDAALIEATLADGKGESFRRKLARKRPDCRVLVFTNAATAREQHELLSLGEEDYILSQEDLIELIRGAGVAESSASGAHIKQVRSLVEVIDVLVGLLEMGDDFFGGTSHRVMKLAREISEEMSVEEETLYEVVLAALLRDVGRGSLSPQLLESPGEFNELQRRAVAEHVHGGVRLLEHIAFPWKVRPVIRHHHERYDGRGYPEGLKGREIPVGARVLAVADAYVAMTSDRPHRPAFTAAEAQEELVRGTGSQFDPEVVEAALQVLAKRTPLREGQGRFVVLVADADEEFRNLVRLRLLNEGHEVTEVSEAGAALEEIRRGGLDLVLADTRLPGGEEARDAFDLLRVLRGEEASRDLPFAFLAGRDDRVTKVRALRLGVDDFIGKSQDLEEVGARIQNILTREVQRRGSAATARRRGIVGQLESMSLADLTQALAIGMKTAKLSLSCEGGSGVVYFERGQAKHARSAGKEGETAFYRMLLWDEGQFVLEHGVPIKKRTIEVDSMFLLMEGLRRRDEAGAAAT